MCAVGRFRCSALESCRNPNDNCTRLFSNTSVVIRLRGLTIEGGSREGGQCEGCNVDREVNKTESHGNLTSTVVQALMQMSRKAQYD
jgi:hypothetical protein